jgi:hypothetical protein
VIADIAVWHASLVEILWMMIGLTGMVIGWSNLADSRENLKALQTMNGNNIASHRVVSVLAYGHYRNDLFRFSKHTMIALIGVISCIVPPSTRTQPVTATGLIVTMGLFYISIALLMASTLDRRQRESLEALANE